MKKVLALSLALLGGAAAQEYKAVFDCASSDPRYIMSRMLLIEKTKQQIEAAGERAVFAITMHSGCVKAASENADYLVKEDEVVFVRKTQEVLERLAKKEKVEVIACAIALAGNAIDREEVLPFIRISENSYIDTIGYQNRGYALMPLK